MEEGSGSVDGKRKGEIECGDRGEMSGGRGIKGKKGLERGSEGEGLLHWLWGICRRYDIKKLL